MSRATSTVIVGLLIIPAAVAIAVWAGIGDTRTPQQQAAAMMVDGKLAGRDRDNFIASTVASCNVSAMRTNPNAPIDRVDAACKCVAAKEADTITQDQIAYLIEHKGVSPELQATLKRQLDECTK